VRSTSQNTGEDGGRINGRSNCLKPWLINLLFALALALGALAWSVWVHRPAKARLRQARAARVILAADVAQVTRKVIALSKQEKLLAHENPALWRMIISDRLHWTGSSRHNHADSPRE
jgi:hypothetical protein